MVSRGGSEGGNGRVLPGNIGILHLEAALNVHLEPDQTMVPRAT